MNELNEWVIKDRIKKGVFKYRVGDEVIIFKRKSNGYPRQIKDGITYYIKKVDTDGHLLVAQKSLDGSGFLQPVRVHKIYMMCKSLLRDIKLNSILDKTNDIE